MTRRLLTAVICGLCLALATSPASAELVVYLSFDGVDGGDGGDVPDGSGLGNDGVIEGDVDVVAGAEGDALAFADSRVLIQASDSFTDAIFADGQFTVGLWMSPALAGNAWQQVFRAGNAPNDTLFVNNDGRLSWRGMVGGAWAGGMAETEAGALAAETWAHAVVTSDGDKFRIYVDGEMVVDGAFQETMGANVQYAVGGFGGGESYTGSIDEFFVFNEPLADADILSISEDGMPAYLGVEAAGKLATQWGDLKRAR